MKYPRLLIDLPRLEDNVRQEVRLLARSRRALSLVELLVALAVLTAAALPALWLQVSTARAVRVDRARLACEALCVNLTGWFGRWENDPWELLTPTSDPRERVGVDIWKRDVQLRQALEDPGLEEVLAAHAVETTVQMIHDVEPDVHQLTVEVTWDAAPERRERVSHARLLVRPRR